MPEAAHLSPEDIKAIATEVRSGMLKVSQDLSDFFIFPSTRTYSIAIMPERSATDNLHLDIEVHDTSIILTWWAWGYVILDRFMFERPR